MDVSQDCFLRLARSAAAITGSLGAWLHRTSLNRAREVLRSESSRLRREAKAAARDDRAESDDANELVARVDEGLSSLPEELRAVLTEHFLCGRSQSEIAASLGMSQSTVSRRIEKGLEQLRAWLGENGWPAALAAPLPALLAGGAMHVGAPASVRAALTKIGLSGVGRSPVTPAGAASVSVMAKAAIGMGVCLAIASAVLISWSALGPSRPRQLVVPAAPAGTPAVSPTTSSGPMEVQAMVPDLTCSDLSAAQKYYATLGFALAARDASSGSIAVHRDDETLLLVPKTPPFVGPVSVNVLVQNVAAYQREFTAKGVTVQPLPASSVINPSGSSRFSVTDPDGNRLTFVEEPGQVREK
jgi:RNA polymerase sigma factor (sigma-70 family)